MDLTKEPDSAVVKPYLGEYIEAHRQREGALGMAAEDININSTGTGTGAAAAPAPRTKGKKRKRKST